MTTTALVVCLAVLCLILAALVLKSEVRATLKVWRVFSFSLDARSRRSPPGRGGPPSQRPRNAG